jgi:heat shock protein HspQ
MDSKPTRQPPTTHQVVYEFQPTPVGRFQAGQLVRSRVASIRGVVVDVHPHFSGTGEWYERLPEAAPSRDQPWYEILFHDSQRMSYVAEEALEPDYSGMPINHPMVRLFFNEFGEGRYRVGGPTN